MKQTKWKISHERFYLKIEVFFLCLVFSLFSLSNTARSQEAIQLEIGDAFRIESMERGNGPGNRPIRAYLCSEVLNNEERSCDKDRVKRHSFFSGQKPTNTVDLKDKDVVFLMGQCTPAEGCPALVARPGKGAFQAAFKPGELTDINYRVAYKVEPIRGLAGIVEKVPKTQRYPVLAKLVEEVANAPAGTEFHIDNANNIVSSQQIAEWQKRYSQLRNPSESPKMSDSGAAERRQEIKDLHRKLTGVGFIPDEPRGMPTRNVQAKAGGAARPASRESPSSASGLAGPVQAGSDLKRDSPSVLRTGQDPIGTGPGRAATGGVRNGLARSPGDPGSPGVKAANSISGNSTYPTAASGAANSLPVLGQNGILSGQSGGSPTDSSDGASSFRSYVKNPSTGGSSADDDYRIRNSDQLAAALKFQDSDTYRADPLDQMVVHSGQNMTSPNSVQRFTPMNRTPGSVQSPANDYVFAYGAGFDEARERKRWKDAVAGLGSGPPLIYRPDKGLQLQPISNKCTHSHNGQSGARIQLDNFMDLRAPASGACQVVSNPIEGTFSVVLAHCMGNKSIRDGSKEPGKCMKVFSGYSEKKNRNGSKDSSISSVFTFSKENFSWPERSSANPAEEQAERDKQYDSFIARIKADCDGTLKKAGEPIFSEAYLFGNREQTSVVDGKVVRKELPPLSQEFRDEVLKKVKMNFGFSRNPQIKLSKNKCEIKSLGLLHPENFYTGKSKGFCNEELEKTMVKFCKKGKDKVLKTVEGKIYRELITSQSDPKAVALQKEVLKLKEQSAAMILKDDGADVSALLAEANRATAELDKWAMAEAKKAAEESFKKPWDERCGITPGKDGKKRRISGKEYRELLALEGMSLTYEDKVQNREDFLIQQINANKKLCMTIAAKQKNLESSFQSLDSGGGRQKVYDVDLANQGILSPSHSGSTSAARPVF